jgi:hypothetical protein
MEKEKKKSHSQEANMGFPSNGKKQKRKWKRTRTETSSTENRRSHLEKNGSGTFAELMARPSHITIIRLDRNLGLPEILSLYY